MLQGINTSDLAAKKYFIAIKAEFDNLGINKLTHILTSLNNLKTKIDDLYVGKSKTVPAGLKKLSGTVDNEVVKNAKLNTLKTKVNNLLKKIPDAATLIHINQYNKNKKKIEKKTGDVDKIITDTRGLGTKTALNTKVSEVEYKVADNSKYITTH